MGRWQPEARARLERAALELFAERGFEHTTVAEIATRAGLTERTFFRYFADKREVLFGGSAGPGSLNEVLAAAVACAPTSATPLDVVRAAIVAVAELLEGRRDQAGRRRTVIDSSPELREREMIKLAVLGETLAHALRERGLADPAATLCADAGISIFKAAFARWIDDPRTTFRGEVDAVVNEFTLVIRRKVLTR